MRKISVIGFILLVLLTSLALAQKNPKDAFQYPPLNKIQVPQVKEEILPNGMRLLLLEDPAYPTIDLRAMIRTGSIWEPADKIGLASLVGAGRSSQAHRGCALVIAAMKERDERRPPRSEFIPIDSRGPGWSLPDRSPNGRKTQT